MKSSPMRQDLILRILGEDLFSGTLQKTTNNIKQQSQSLGGYFTNINKHYQGLVKNYKNFLQNSKNGVLSIGDPLYIKNTKEAERNFKKAEQAYKVFQDSRITSAKEYSDTIDKLNKKIENGIKGQQKLLQQGLSPSAVFKVYDKQTKGYINKKLGSLIQERLQGSLLSKTNSNIQSLITGVIPANPVRGLIKTVENALNIPNIKTAKAKVNELKELSTKVNSAVLQGGTPANTQIFTVNGTNYTYDEAKKAIGNLSYYQSLANKSTRNKGIATAISRFSENYLLNNLPSYALYKDLENFSKTGNLPIVPTRAEAVKNWLTAQGFTVEKSWPYFNASNKIGGLKKQEAELRALYPRLDPIKQQYQETEKAYLKAIEEEDKNTQKITKADITQGQRDLARRLINFASPEKGKGNYFNDLAKNIALTSGEDRTRLLNSIKAQAQEYAYYANGVMQMFGLDPKSGRWYYNRHSQVNFQEHLKEIAKEKNLSGRDQKLLRNLFNTVTNNVLDPANNIKEDLKGEVSRKAYLKQFNTVDKNFIQSLTTPIKTDTNKIAQYQENVRQLDTARGHILNTLNTYNGIKLNQDFKQEDLDKQLKNSNITYKNQRQRVQELGRAYLTATDKREKFNNAIQEGQKLQSYTYDEKQIKTLNDQSNDIYKTYRGIQNSAPYKQLIQGNAVTADDFKNAKIVETTEALKGTLQNYVSAFGKLGVKNVTANIRKDTLERNIALFRETEAYKTATTAQRSKIDANISSLQNGFIPLNNAYRDLTAITETQNRNRSNKLVTPEQQAKQLSRNRLDDINQKNMSFYALSHAIKSIEAPLQQAYDYGRGSIDEYVNFQSAMVGVAKLLPVLRDPKTLLVNEKFEEFRAGVLNLTETLPMSGVELARASESASRLGVTNPDQIRNVVEAGTKLGVAFGMNADDVTKQVVKIANAKGIDLNKSGSMEKVMEFADAINYLDDHTAASGREIINFTKKAVQTAEGVKMDTKDVSAFGATLVSLGISADSANTGFKNLMTVLQTGPRNQKKGVEYLEKSGVSVKDLMTQFKKNPTETAVAFIKRLNKLRTAPAGADAASIVRFAFGQMSSQAIMALVNNPEVLDRYLAMARNDSKGWTEKEFQARQKNDPAVRFKLFENKLKVFATDLGEALMPVADNFMKVSKNLIRYFSNNNKELNQNILRKTAVVTAGALGFTKLASFGADMAIILNNLRNFEWFDKISKIPFFKGTGWAGIIGALGAGATVYTYYKTNEAIENKQLEKNKKEEEVKGTVKDRQRRYTAEHSNTFQSRKLIDLQHRLNEQGYEIVNDNGELVINKLIKDEEGNITRERIKEGIEYFKKASALDKASFSNPTTALYGIYQGFMKGIIPSLQKKRIIDGITEEQNPQLFATIDEYKRINASMKSAEARQGIRPNIAVKERLRLNKDTGKFEKERIVVNKATGKKLRYEDPLTGEIITDVDESNINNWNYITNRQRFAANKRVKLEEEKRKTLKAQKAAENAGDIGGFQDSTDKLAQIQKDIVNLDGYEKKLRDISANVDWERANGFEIYTNFPKFAKLDKYKKGKKALDYQYLGNLGFDQYGSDLQTQTRAYQLANLLDYEAKLNDMRTRLGRAKSNKEKGIKDFYGTGYVYDNEKFNQWGANGYQEINNQLYTAQQEIAQLKKKLGEQGNQVQPFSKGQPISNTIDVLNPNKNLSGVANILNPFNLDDVLKRSTEFSKTIDNIKTKGTNLEPINKGFVAIADQVKVANTEIKSCNTSLDQLNNKTVVATVKVDTSQAQAQMNILTAQMAMLKAYSAMA